MWDTNSRRDLLEGNIFGRKSNLYISLEKNKSYNLIMILLFKTFVKLNQIIALFLIYTQYPMQHEFLNKLM